MTRRPEDYHGVGEPVRGDVADPASLAGALQGCDAAYYLVHRLGEKNFARADAEAASAFAAAAAEAHVGRIIYLGGLGDTQRRPLGASAQSARGRDAARRGRRSRHGAAGRDHCRRRRNLLGDDPSARRAPACHDHPALGPHQDPADRHRRCHSLSGGRAREARGDRARVFDIGGPEVLEYAADDASRRRHRGKACSWWCRCPC